MAFLLNPIGAYAAEGNADYEAMVAEVADQYNLCPELIESIIFYESSWQPDVVSSAGCIGLMQIHPKSHKKRMQELGVTDLYDPYSNILVGCDYLFDLFEEYKDVSIVLDAYGGTLKDMSEYESGYVGKHTKLVLKRAEELERANGK